MYISSPSAILQLLGWPLWRSETCYREQTIESKTSFIFYKTFSHRKWLVLTSMTSLMRPLIGERDSLWAWSWARKSPSLSEDPRWPLDTTLLLEVSKWTTLKENLAFCWRSEFLGGCHQRRWIIHPSCPAISWKGYTCCKRTGSGESSRNVGVTT